MRDMNRVLLAGAILAVLLTLAHAIGGHVTNLRRLAGGSLAEGEKLELHVVWHLYSWQLALSALALLAVLGGAVPVSRPLLVFIALTFGGGGVLFMVLTARRGVGELVRHPQWAFLTLLGALAWWGA
jgi:hypothetical protein